MKMIAILVIFSLSLSFFLDFLSRYKPCYPNPKVRNPYHHPEGVQAIERAKAPSPRGHQPLWRRLVGECRGGFDKVETLVRGQALMSALSGLQWIFSKGCAESSRPCKSMLAHFRAAQGGADVLVARLGPSDPHESQNMFRVPASVYVHT